MSQRTTRASVALLPLLLLLVSACGGGASKDDPAVAPANEGIKGVLAIRIASAKHTEGTVVYDRHPPAGGDHNPIPAPCGFYDQVIPDEFVVHTLEHGAVWLAYSPALSEADLNIVRKLTDENADVIATPYEGLDDGVAVVATAWARQLTLTSVHDPRIAAFVARYQNGKQAPEGTTACARKV